MAIVFLFFIFYFYFLILKDLPSPYRLSSLPAPQSTRIYDRNHQLLYNIYGQYNRTNVKLEQIPDHLVDATIAIEDKDFYKHRGFAVRGVLRALREIIFHGRLQGGSTISQQLIKNTLLTPERTIRRKVKEWILAFLAERIYRKEEILEMYLNTVAYGGTAWGVEAAAETYFDKNVSDLNIEESALLAGLPAAPTSFSPFGARPELAKKRQLTVLRRMREDGYLTSQQEKEIGDRELKFKPQRTDIKAPHFVMYVKDLLVKKYGQRQVEQGGLQVITTLDLELQEFSQQVVASEAAKLKPWQVGNGAALVIKPPTGEILAMVGSVDYFASPSGNFNVTLGLRQPGSAIKPINYAAGIAKRIVTPASLFADKPTCFPNPPRQPYCPVNYDGRFHGAVQLRFALGSSYNIPAVKMLKLNGVSDMIATASAMGITTFSNPSRYGLSLTLGGGEVSMIEMAEAFAVFANAGIRVPLRAILKVIDSQNKVLEEFNSPLISIATPTTHITLPTSNYPHPLPGRQAGTSQEKFRSRLLIQGKEILDPGTAYLISHILLDNNARARAFGPNSALVIKGHPEVSVKTGTTDDLRDNWTIGFTPSFLAAAWVGNNDNSPMNRYLVSGITGAAPIWNKIISKTLEDQKEEWPIKPANIVGLSICALSGRLPGDSGCPTRYEYFINGTQPTEVETGMTKVFVDVTTGNLAKEGQTENVAEQDHLIIKDALGETFCLTCPANQLPNPPPEESQ